jgi:hypothetical protein
VISLIVLFIRLSVKMIVLAVCATIWLVWVIVALPMMLVASARGNDQSARQWERSMRWRFGRITLLPER